MFLGAPQEAWQRRSKKCMKMPHGSFRLDQFVIAAVVLASTKSISKTAISYWSADCPSSDVAVAAKDSSRGIAHFSCASDGQNGGEILILLLQV